MEPPPASSREGEEPGPRNQNLLTLIHACKSVDPEHDDSAGNTGSEQSQGSASLVSPLPLLEELREEQQNQQQKQKQKQDSTDGPNTTPTTSLGMTTDHALYISGTESVGGLLNTSPIASTPFVNSPVGNHADLAGKKRELDGLDTLQDHEVVQSSACSNSVGRSSKKRGRSISRRGRSSRSGVTKLSKLELELERAVAIIRRCHARGGALPRNPKREPSSGGQEGKKNKVKRQVEPESSEQSQCRIVIGTEEKVEHELKQEYQDAAKLRSWKQALLREGECNTSSSSFESNSSCGSGCPEEVRALLDQNLPHWRDPSLKRAHEIVQRYVQRGGILPREWRDRKGCPQREQEYQDANKLKHWKQAVRGLGGRSCSAEVREYLDSHLPFWRQKERKSRKQLQQWQPGEIVLHSDSCSSGSAGEIPRTSLIISGSTAASDSSEQPQGGAFQPLVTLPHSIEQEVVTVTVPVPQQQCNISSPTTARGGDTELLLPSLSTLAGACVASSEI